MADGDQIPALKALYNNDPTRLVRKSMVKIYADGLLDSTTAAMLTSYKVDLHLDLPGGNKGEQSHGTTIHVPTRSMCSLK